MAKLKKVGVLFLAKLQGLVMAVAGLIAGILYAFVGSGALGWAVTAHEKLVGELHPFGQR